jgi:6-phosphogluconolactonase (cycloisomerase 2 family)
VHLVKSICLTIALLLVTSAVLFSKPAYAQAATSETSSEDASTSKLPAPRFFYSTEYLNGKVGGYIVNPSTGELYSNGQPAVWAHYGPTKIASDSGGHHLYVANQGSHDVSAYSIDRSNGWLSAVPGANFPVGGISSDIAVHPSNKFVYVTTSDTDYVGITGKSNSVSAFSVASNGSLVQVPGSPFITDGPDWGIAIDPSGKYLYASSQVSDKNEDGEINAFSINQKTGALTPIPGSPFPVIPYTCQICFNWETIYGMAIDPTGHFLLGGGELNGVVHVYRIEEGTGSIGEVAGSPFVVENPSCAGVGSCFPGAAVTDVTVTPNDKYVFVSSQYGVNGLARFKFDSSTGALSDIIWSPSPYNTWLTDSGVVRSDPSGKFVYTLGNVESEPGMIGFANGANGSMTIVPNAPYPDPGVYAFPPTNLGVDGIVVTP